MENFGEVFSESMEVANKAGEISGIETLSPESSVVGKNPEEWRRPEEAGEPQLDESKIDWGEDKTTDVDDWKRPEEAEEPQLDESKIDCDTMKDTQDVSKTGTDNNIESATNEDNVAKDGAEKDELPVGQDRVETEKSELTEADKLKLKEETGWSDEIVDSISSKEEAEIYKNEGLVEKEVNGKKCLVREDIDWEQKDVLGRTNTERAEQGLSPLDKDGKQIELHHIGQKSDSPLAELTQESHRGKGNDGILHNKTQESEIDRNEFNSERENHWKNRANMEVH